MGTHTFNNNWAVIVPMANEEPDFAPFVESMTDVLNSLNGGNVYLVVDTVSTDRTLTLCQGLSRQDPRFTVIWAPENRHVVDAYIRGYREAFDNGHDIIIEMDAGLSHDPHAIPMFLQALNEGCECAFGSRFVKGGSMTDSPLKRRMLSRCGTFLANMLLGTRLFDMTSGFQGFRANVVAKLLQHKFVSTAHFFQTEVRYLLRKHRYTEIPIHYQAPSPRVSKNAIRNALNSLGHYFVKRLTGNPAIIE